MSELAKSGQFTVERMTPEEHRKIRDYYFGECGDGKGFYPKRHRWDGKSWCKWCGLAKEPTP